MKYCGHWITKYTNSCCPYFCCTIHQRR
jgi:hypothetical protein